MKTLSQLWSSTPSIPSADQKLRAHSASSLKSLGVIGGPRWTKTHARSTPELRLYMQQSMLSGLNTTVPQSIIPQYYGSKHSPKRKHHADATTGHCHCLCSCKLFLVILQLFMGAIIASVAFYLYFFISGSVRVRETSYWAGIPLFLAGVSGLAHCANEKGNTTKRTKHFILKALCFLLSLVCIFVCLVASTFPAIHVAKLQTFQLCEEIQEGCMCYESESSRFHGVLYHSPGDCSILFCVVRTLLLIETVTCALGSIVCFWFVILLWRSKYGGVYTGVPNNISSNNNRKRVVV